ncbi:MAG: sensor protein [Gemmatimonadetes bacterium]|nr:sensor protein [Gemmatimonadota bacterium]
MPNVAGVRDRLILPVLALLAVVVGGGIFLRVQFLRGATMSTWHKVLDGGAATTQATLDDWYAERTADVEGLAATVSLHASVTAPGDAHGASLSTLFAPLARRGKFVGVWIVGDSARVLSSATSDTLFPAERAAIREAVEKDRTAHSTVTPLGLHTAFFSIAAPVHSPPGGPRALLLRTDVVASFSPWAVGRVNAALSLFSTPGADGPVVISVCPDQSPSVCITSTRALSSRTPVVLSLAREEKFGVFPSFDGAPVVASTRYDTTLGWGIVRRVRESDAFVPMQKELLIEGAFLAVVIALCVVGGVAINRTIRVRLLNEQREATQRLTTVVNASTDGIITLDERFNIISVNGAVERILGFRSEQLVGTAVLELFAGEWHDILGTSLREFSRSGLAQAPLAENERCVAVCTDGRLVPVDARVSRAVFDGVPLFVVGLRDVSERARAEQFLQGQRHVLELIASGAPAPATMSVMLELIGDEAPRMRCAVYELDDDRVLARIVSAPAFSPTVFAVLDSVSVSAGSGPVGSAIYSGEPVFCPDVKNDPACRNSFIALVQCGILGAWAIPLRAADGQVIGALAGFCSEARAPNAKEQELARAAAHLASIALSSARNAASVRASEASFRSFVENAPAAIFRETRRGVLVSANPAMAALLGYSGVPELSRAAEQQRLYHDAAARMELCRRLDESDVVRGMEVEWRRADGSLVTVRLSAQAYRDDRNTVWLWEGYAEDVTSLRAAELALRRSERLAAVGQLISGVAHELNNPLSSIMHYAEDLLNDERSSDDAEALHVIRDQARRSRSIVRDLLSFVRQRATNTVPIWLGEVVAQTARAMRPTLEESGVQLHLAEGPYNTLVLADRAGIEQIVANLVSNAAQAAGPGGGVWVVSERSDAGCVLMVEDSGPGVPAEILPRIFDPFFTTKPIGEGTGLGLSVTLGIVEQFGGRIAVGTRDAGSGSRFTVFLPYMEPGTMTSFDRSGQTSADGDPRRTPESVPVVRVTPKDEPGPDARIVLIIDDEPTIRAALKRYFTRRGWAVEEAGDGAAGIKQLERLGDRIAVVISDLRMPGFSGIELHDQLALSHPELLRRFVFSTGDVASAEAASFVQRTACPVLQKPFELQALDTIIATVLNGTVAQRALA